MNPVKVHLSPFRKSVSNCLREFQNPLSKVTWSPFSEKSPVLISLYSFIANGLLLTTNNAQGRFVWVSSHNYYWHRDHPQMLFYAYPKNKKVFKIILEDFLKILNFIYRISSWISQHVLPCQRIIFSLCKKDVMPNLPQFWSADIHFRPPIL